MWYLLIHEVTNRLTIDTKFIFPKTVYLCFLCASYDKRRLFP